MYIKIKNLQCKHILSYKITLQKKTNIKLRDKNTNQSLKQKHISGIKIFLRKIRLKNRT
jgi:hypothetical protein